MNHEAWLRGITDKRDILMNAMLLHKVDGTMKDESITWVNLGNHYIYILGSATCKSSIHS